MKKGTIEIFSVNKVVELIFKIIFCIIYIKYVTMLSERRKVEISLKVKKGRSMEL